MKILLAFFGSRPGELNAFETVAVVPYFSINFCLFNPKSREEGTDGLFLHIPKDQERIATYLLIVHEVIEDFWRVESMINRVLSVFFKHLAVHCHQQTVQKKYIMGNDILKPHKKQVYIKTKLLTPSRSQSKMNQNVIQKVFGKLEDRPLRKNHTISYIIPGSSIQEVIQEENTFEEEEEIINSPLPLRETHVQNSINTHENTESINLLQEEIHRMRKMLFDQNFSSKNHSPVRREEERIEKIINGSNTRNCKHYFKLKGCEKRDSLQEKQLRRMR